MATLCMVETSRWLREFVSSDMIIEKKTLSNSCGTIRVRNPQWLSPLCLWTWSSESQSLRFSDGDREGLWEQRGCLKKAFAPLWVSANKAQQKLPVRRNLETVIKLWLLHCRKFIFLTWFYFLSNYAGVI